MAGELKAGDAVQVVDREATQADEKASQFFNYFRNLTGTLERVYNDGKATVVVDEDSLPAEILERHKELTEKARSKWLEGLSDEARNRLTAEEKQFRMRYSILVRLEDLTRKGVKKPAKKAAGSPEAISTNDLDAAEEAALKARKKK